MSEVEGDTNEIDIVPSKLDTATHAEMLMMYQEAATSIRFYKANQWRTLVGGMIFLVGILVYGEYTPERLYGTAAWLIVICSVVTTGVIYILIVHQLLQNLERKKLVKMSEHLSSLFLEVRSIRSPTETAFHRYTLLLFMMIGLIGTCMLVIQLLIRFV